MGRGYELMKEGMIALILDQDFDLSLPDPGVEAEKGMLNLTRGAAVTPIHDLGIIDPKLGLAPDRLILLRERKSQ